MVIPKFCPRPVRFVRLYLFSARFSFMEGKSFIQNSDFFNVKFANCTQAYVKGAVSCGVSDRDGAAKH